MQSTSFSVSYSHNLSASLSLDISKRIDQFLDVRQQHLELEHLPEDEDWQDHNLRPPNSDEEDMDLGIITSIAACPAIVGTNEAIKLGQQKSEKEKHRSIKTNLVVQCVGESRHKAQIHGGFVVLKHNRVGTTLYPYAYINTINPSGVGREGRIEAVCPLNVS